MNSLLKDVTALDDVINCLRKMESMMKNGQFIGAYREYCRLIGVFEKNKHDIVASSEKKND